MKRLALPTVPAGAPAPAGSKSTVERIIAAIKDGIQQGRYAPGQRLIEPELSHELAGSRGSIREALRRLTAEGFVEWKQFSGATIRRMSRTEVLELGQVRELLEGLAAALATERITPAQRRELIELERALDRNDGTFRRYADYNVEFHNLILRASAQSQLPVFLERTQLPILRLQFFRVLDEEVPVARSRAEHRAVVEAILAGNAKLAETKMRLHVRNSTAAILAAPAHYFSSEATRA